MLDRSYRLFLSWQNFVASPKSFHQTIVGLEANCTISRPVMRGEGRFLSLIEDLSLLNTMTSATLLKEVGTGDSDFSPHLQTFLKNYLQMPQAKAIYFSRSGVI